MPLLFTKVCWQDQFKNRQIMIGREREEVRKGGAKETEKRGKDEEVDELKDTLTYKHETDSRQWAERGE